MNNYSKLTEGIIDFVSLHHPEVKLQVVHAEYQGMIHVFFLEFDTAKRLEATWQALSNAIAVHYQSKVASEFERWNFYIFYLLDKKVPRDLKFQIENDPISSRKIVIESYFGPLTGQSCSTIIDEHITNRNVKFSLLPQIKKTSKKEEFPKNKLLAQAIDQHPQTDKKKKSDDQTGQILQLIEKHFSDEV